jgi:MSHA pilin protein MshD
VSLKRKISNPFGFTLIEVIVTIVVLSVAATAIMGMFTNTIRTSADPMIQQQALSIAEAYMEEILLKSFDDPDGTEAGETRGSYDDVDDYDALTNAAIEDQNGNPIGILSDFTVSVTVTTDVLNTIVSADAFLIRVSVAHAVLDPIVLHGYRTRY